MMTCVVETEIDIESGIGRQSRILPSPTLVPSLLRRSKDEDEDEDEDEAEHHLQAVESGSMRSSKERKGVCQFACKLPPYFMV